ncbi:MAG: phage portal protein, partial [Planctomycetota bacterium]
GLFLRDPDRSRSIGHQRNELDGPVRIGPIRTVAIAPSPEIKRFDFVRTLTSWALGWGNGIAYIDRPNWPDPNGTIEFIPLMPDRTRPVRITEKQAKHYDIDRSLIGKLFYETMIDDETVAYPHDDCIHIRGLGPNPYWGYDVCTLLIEHLGGVKARAEFGQRFYGQGANPAGIIEHPGQLSEPAAERLKRTFDEKMEGMSRAHRAILLEDGAKYSQLTIDPQKAQFLEGLEFDYRILANIVGIKVHKLTDVKVNAYASLEMAESEHRDDDIIPWVMQWGGEYNHKMLTQRQFREGTHVIACDDEYLDGWVSFSDKATGVVELRNNDMITRNEGRRRLNFPPTKDRDGDRFMSPMNIDFTDTKNSLVDAGASAGDNATQIVAGFLSAPSTESLAESDGSPLTETNVVCVGAVAAVEPEADAGGDELRSAWLAKVRSRLGKRATKPRETAEFIEWLDQLAAEDAPECIQADVDALYQDIKTRLTAVVDQTLPEGTTLAERVAEVVSEWEKQS